MYYTEIKRESLEKAILGEDNYLHSIMSLVGDKLRVINNVLGLNNPNNEPDETDNVISQLTQDVLESLNSDTVEDYWEEYGGLRVNGYWDEDADGVLVLEYSFRL